MEADYSLDDVSAIESLINSASLAHTLLRVSVLTDINPRLCAIMAPWSPVRIIFDVQKVIRQSKLRGGVSPVGLDTEERGKMNGDSNTEYVSQYAFSSSSFSLRLLMYHVHLIVKGNPWIQRSKGQIYKAIFERVGLVR